MADLIIYPEGSKLNNLERRTLARAEMAHYPDNKIFQYLKFSPHIRHLRLSRHGILYHSIADVLNIVYSVKRKDAAPDFNPNQVWQDVRKRFKGDDEFMENIHKLKLPSWDDQKWYPTDALSSGWLFVTLLELKTPYTNRIRRAVVKAIDQVDRNGLINTIEQQDAEIFGVGSEITLLMQSIYEQGDYDEPPYQAKEW